MLTFCPNRGSQLNKSLMKSVPNSMISIITHCGIALRTHVVRATMTYARNPPNGDKKKSNQNSQDASIPLENRKVSILCSTRYALKSITFDYVCDEHVYTTGCKYWFLHLLHQRTNQRGSKFHLILEFWLIIPINRWCERLLWVWTLIEHSIGEMGITLTRTRTHYYFIIT